MQRLIRHKIRYLLFYLVCQSRIWRGGYVSSTSVEEVKGYLSSVEGTNRRGRPHGRWEDRVKEYVSERGVRGNGLEWARRECVDRKRWRSVCNGHPLGGRFRME